jgi:hypothetical protein
MTQSSADARKLRCDVLLTPFHPLNEDPALALRRDLELLEHLDRLGFDEAISLDRRTSLRRLRDRLISVVETFAKHEREQESS